MTFSERLFMSKAAAAAMGAASPLSGQGGMASTILRGMPKFPAAPNSLMKPMGPAAIGMPKFPAAGPNLMKPMGPAAIGMSKIAPGGLTDKARPGLKV